MASDLFIRNPWGIRSLLPPSPQIAFSQMYLNDVRVTAEAFVQFHLVGQQYRMLVVDIDETTDWTPSGKVTHPTWIYGDKQSRLESYLREQHPMVVIAGLPVFNPPFIDFFDWLSRLQREYPETVIHLHGGNSFRQIFGLGLRSVDYDPSEDCQNSSVRLPCGRVVRPEEWGTWGKWFRMLGFDWRKIQSFADRCEFCLASAHWGAQYFRSEIPFSVRDPHIGVRVGDEPPIAGDFVDRYRRAHAEDGDKVICDACSLASRCKLYREGAVCTLKESPSAELAQMFGSRNSDQIIAGLNKLLAMNAERVVEARDRESTAEDGLDDKVTRLIDNMINQGVKIAKLVNPALANPKLQIQIGLAQVQGGGTPPANQLASAAIAELVRRGHPRESITVDMVEAVIRETVSETAAIEAGEVNDASE